MVCEPQSQSPKAEHRTPPNCALNKKGRAEPSPTKLSELAQDLRDFQVDDGESVERHRFNQNQC